MIYGCLQPRELWFNHIYLHVVSNLQYTQYMYTTQTMYVEHNDLLVAIQRVSGVH